MSFEFDSDWGDAVAEKARELSNGKLPGKFGLLQDVVGHWAIPKLEKGILRYGKAVLDTFGTCYSYHREQKDELMSPRTLVECGLRRKGMNLPAQVVISLSQASYDGL